MLSSDGSLARSVLTTPPPTFTSLVPRDSYDTSSPTALHSLGPTVRLRLGDIVLARSGDKGPNLNIGFFVRDTPIPNKSATTETFALAWEWLRAWLSRERFIDDLVGPEDWDQEQFHVERVEFARIKAVHFVVYGFLGRGVSSSPRLDCFGKGFADYVRDKWVDVPAALLPMRSPDGRRVDEIERALAAA